MPQPVWPGRWRVAFGLVLVTLVGRPDPAASAPPPPLWVDSATTITLAGPAAEPALAGPQFAEIFAPQVALGPGSSPGGGYLPLSLFGTLPIAGVGDDSLLNFNVPGFVFGAKVYTRLGISSNGYVVLGGGAGADSSFINQTLPDPLRPNNVLAPFWTDLNPGAAGAVRIGTLTDGTDTWIVVDWEAVREFSAASKTHSFQVWIGINSDAHPDEDVSYAYGAQTGNGDGGFLTVGVENWNATSGAMTYVDGSGSLPVNGTQLRVTTDTHSTTYLPLVQR